MPSMTLTMSEIRRDESEISPIVSTIRSTCLLPSLATSDAARAKELAESAARAFRRTPLAISAIEAPAIWSELACSSVLAERSMLPCAISDEADITDSDELCIAVMARRMRLVIKASERSISPVSLRASDSMLTVRSPSATSDDKRMTSFNGPEIDLKSSAQATTAEATAITASTTDATRARVDAEPIASKAKDAFFRCLSRNASPSALLLSSTERTLCSYSALATSV